VIQIVERRAMSLQNGSECLEVLTHTCREKLSILLSCCLCWLKEADKIEFDVFEVELE
jgi:hypothetical protein